jgi:chemotaxis protein methyltransferase CheR
VTETAVSLPSTSRTVRSLVMTDRDFHKIRELVAHDSGVHLAVMKRDFVALRVSRRVRALGLDTFQEYVSLASSDLGERLEMFDCVLDTGTRFFRERRHFDYLERLVIPRWIDEAHRGRRVRSARVWSAGCSTGQEPVSLAMILLAAVPGWNLEIVGSDLSKRALGQASTGLFGVENAEEIPSRYRRKFVLRGPDENSHRMTVCDRVRSVIRYRRINLNVALPETGPFDLIFCCNVLDYFDPASRALAVRRLLSRLAPGGYLFLGHSDGAIDTDGHVRSIDRSIYRAELPV